MDSKDLLLQNSKPRITLRQQNPFNESFVAWKLQNTIKQIVSCVMQLNLTYLKLGARLYLNWLEASLLRVKDPAYIPHAVHVF